MRSRLFRGKTFCPRGKKFVQIEGIEAIFLSRTRCCKTPSSGYERHKCALATHVATGARRSCEPVHIAAKRVASAACNDGKFVQILELGAVNDWASRGIFASKCKAKLQQPDFLKLNRCSASMSRLGPKS